MFIACLYCIIGAIVIISIIIIKTLTRIEQAHDNNYSDMQR